MHHITEVNFQQGLNDKDDSVLEKLEFDYYEKKREHGDIDNNINNLMDMASNGETNKAAYSMLMNKLNVHADKKLQLESKIRQLKSDIDATKLLNLAPDELNQALTDFYGTLNSLDGDELYIARSKLAQTISTVVDKIYIYMDGYPKDSFKKGERVIYRVQFKMVRIAWCLLITIRLKIILLN